MRANIMAALVTVLAIAGACDNTGTPVAGGTAYFTVPGTANQAVVPYADRDATAAVPTVNGGVPLDAGGRAQVYLAQPADIRIEDSEGETVATYKEVGGTAAGVEVLNAGFTGTDPVSGAQVPGGRTYLDTVLSNIATSVGGPDGYFLASTNGAPRTIKAKFVEQQISVKDFGAIGNGSADDTAACQAAINCVVALGGGVVYFPPGVYLTTAALTVPLVGVDLIGSGPQTSFIFAQNQAQSGVVLSYSSSGATRIWLMGISSVASGATGTGVSVAATAAVQLLSANIGGFRTGLSIASSADCSIISSVVSGIDGDSLSTAIIHSGSGGLSVAGSKAWLAANAISLTSTGKLFLTGSVIGNPTSTTTAGVTVSGAGSLWASGTKFDVNSSAHAVVLGASTVVASISSAGNTFSGDVLDQRAGAPVNYPLTTVTSVTPLPGITDVVRIDAQAGASTVTVNAPAATGFGRPFMLKCRNSSGGAVTWTFAAAYHLSASVAPSNGNQVNLIIAYDPITGHWDEQGRGAVSN